LSEYSVLISRVPNALAAYAGVYNGRAIQLVHRHDNSLHFSAAGKGWYQQMAWSTSNTFEVLVDAITDALDIVFVAEPPVI
jgi:hypothetical protein